MTLLITLLTVTQPVAAADDANQAFVRCLFEEVRAANRSGMAEEVFRSRYARACKTEEAALRKASIAVLKARGHRSPEHRTDALISEARSSAGKLYQPAN